MKKRLCTLTAVLLVTMMVFSACGGGTSASTPAPNAAGTTSPSSTAPSTATGGEKVVALAATAPWMSLSPLAWHSKDAQIAFSYPVFDTLVDITSEGKIIPRLLSSWEQSDDGSVITGKLNPNSKWHDGQKVTADDIVFTFQLFASEKLECERPSMAEQLTGTDASGNCANLDELGVKAIDAETVQFSIKRPTTLTNFFYSFRFPFVLPKHRLKDIPIEKLITDTFWENPVGSGPFKLDSYISGERMEYTVNTEYYLGRPQMDRLIIRVIPANNILSAMMSGEIDSTVYGSLLTYSDYALAKQDKNLTTFEAHGFNNDHILLNNEKLDPKVRKAIDYAINKQALVDDLMHGYARVAISAITPENPYRLAGITGNGYDPEKAKQLLAEANWDSKEKLVCVVQADQALRSNGAVMIQQMLAEVGITMEIQSFDMATISSMLFKGETDMAVMGSASNPFEPSESKFYFNVIPNGWSRMTESSWVDLYDKGGNGVTFDERKEAYYELQRRLVDEVPQVFLYHKDILFVSSQKLTNLPFNDFAIKSWRYWDWQVS